MQRFATNLSEGILGQADSKELWTDSVSHIPDSVLLKPDVKILCVAYGHGTEAVVISLRMLALGRTKEEVRNSIYLIDKNYVFAYYMELKGFANIITADFLEWETDMKFDVIIGNPPYQRGSSKTHKLWIDFLTKAVDMDPAYVVFVIPTLIATGRSENITKLRNQLIDKIAVINYTADNYFTEIGEEICYIVYDKNHTGDTLLIENDSSYYQQNTLQTISKSTPIAIIDKIELSNEPRLQFVSDYKNTDGHATPKYLIEKGIIQTTKSNTHSIEFVHSGSQKYYTSSNHSTGGLPKVFINYSSTYRNMFYGTGVAGKQVECVVVADKQEAEKFISVYTSKLFRFYITEEKTGGFNTGIFNLPELDMSKLWTDEELYAHFNLTQEEIEYIESNVK